MTDRELIELAATAAIASGMNLTQHHGIWYDSDYDTAWDPRRDDGDALRLAFVVGLKLDIAKHEVWYCKTPSLGKWLSIGWVGDIEGLRHAIVRAAAEIEAAK
jgi:hypothetical protein